MKKLIIAMLALMLFAVPASGSYGRRAYLISIVDVLHDKNTEVTSITVNIAGSTAATIYANASTTTAATNPIVDSSTATDITTLTDGYITFWYAGATCDIILSDGTYTKTHASVTPRNTRLMFDSHLYTAMTEFELLDAESMSWGTHDDWVAQSAVTKILTWTPLADNSAFTIGTSGTGLNSDFNVYVGTLLGFKVDAGNPSLVWDGGAATLNHDSNFNVGLCTGTSTGAVNIGGASSGAITVDTAGAIAMNCAGTFGITTDGAATDITVDATTGSLNLAGGQAAADAVTIDSAGGIDVTAVDNIDMTLTSATTADDFAITVAGATNSSLLLASSGTSNDAISLITSAGGLDITVGGTAAAGEDLDLSSVTSINLTSTEDIATGIVLTAIGIDLTASGGSAKDIDLTCTSGSINFTAGESAADSIVITSSIGGIDILAAGAAAGEDIDIIATGSSVNITTTETDVADAIVLTAGGRSLINVKGGVNFNTTYCTFGSNPVITKITGAAGGGAGGTTGDENAMAIDGTNFEYHILGTGQTIKTPSITTNGLDVRLDAVDNEGMELGEGITATSKSSFTTNTDAFYLKVKFFLTDVNDFDIMAIGFRLAAAYQSDLYAYNTYAGINVNNGTINGIDDLNGGAAHETDMVEVWEDGDAHTLEVRISATGAVTQYLDGTAVDTPLVFDWSDNDTVVPFFHILGDASAAGEVAIQSWECGLQN